MTKDQTLFFIISFSISLILLFKYFNYYKAKKKMKLIKCRVTDKTYRTGYEKNTYIYYYEYIHNKEIYSDSDAIRFKILFDPNINDELYIYISNNNPNKTITPYKIVLNRIFLYIAILFIILPFILLL